MLAKTAAAGGPTLMPEILAFTSSLALDRALVREDALGSLAHLAMLADVGIVPRADAVALAKGLFAIAEGAPLPDEEDVHMAIEAKLAETVGPASQLLHSARSRNDQVALDAAAPRARAGRGVARRARGARRDDGRARARRRGDHDARVHPPPARAADLAGLLVARPRRRVRARPRAPAASCWQRRRRDAARRRRDRGDLAADRSRSRARPAPVLAAHGERPRYGRRSRLRARLVVRVRAPRPARVADRHRRRRLHDQRVRVREARRRDRVRLEHDAAEEEPRRVRARPRQGRSRDRRSGLAPDHDQGPARRLQPRSPGGSRPAARDRRAQPQHRRGAGAGAAARARSIAERCRAAAIDDDYTQATDLAEALVLGRGVPFRTPRTRRSARWFARAAIARPPARRARRSSRPPRGPSTRASTPRSSPPLDPTALDGAQAGRPAPTGPRRDRRAAPSSSASARIGAAR